MAEFAVEAEFTIPDDANLTDAVVGNAAEHPDLGSFQRKVDGSWESVTAKEFAEQATPRLAELATAVRAAEQMPASRRRTAFKAISAELDGIEQGVLTHLGITT